MEQSPRSLNLRKSLRTSGRSIANNAPTYKNGVKNDVLETSKLSSSSRQSQRLVNQSKKTGCGQLKHCSPKTPITHWKQSQTITLESSTDTDIIDASIEELPPQFSWLRTPRRDVDQAATSLKSIPAPLTSHNRFDKTPQGALIDSRCLGPSYLEKSKQRNIQEWLAASAAFKEPAPALTPSPEPIPADDDLTGLDPAVKDVLMAVYGSNWKEHHQKKCQTDVKRKRQADSASKTDLVSKKQKLMSVTAAKKAKNLFSEVGSLVKTGKSVTASPKKTTGSGVRRKIFGPTPGVASDICMTPINKLSSTNCMSPSSPCLVPLPSTTKKKKKPKLSAPISPLESISTPALVTRTPVTTPAPSSNLRRTPQRTFLASLSVSTPSSVSHPDAQFYKLNFAEKKDELIAKLFKLYNAEIFENKLAADMKITWNVKMRGTAGFCYNRRSVRGHVETRTARIELSTRVIDRADRLRDTLLHEMCHAVVWVTEGVKDGHGPEWRAYATRAQKRFPEIPPVSRCHNYDIAGRFTYRCLSCGYSISRQTKSIDLDRKRCGHCYGKFELLVNKKKRGKTEVPEFDTTRTVRAPNNFALFVKENYKKVKDVEKEKKHGEIMKIIGQQYAIYKSVVTPGKQ